MSSKSKNVMLALATVVVLGIGFTIYLEFFLPHCALSTSAVVRSSDGKHFAYLEWRQCKNPSQSLGQVMMGAGTTSEKIVAIEFRPPEDEVKLDWNADGLAVTLPSTTTVKQYGPYAEWPAVRMVRK